MKLFKFGKMQHNTTATAWERLSTTVAWPNTIRLSFKGHFKQNAV